jgi:putative nucleotidyltransferase with HDIG domain
MPILAGVSGVRRLIPLAEISLLGASVAGIALSWRTSDWHPLGLWVLLLVVALLSDFLAIRVASNTRISASFIAIVLAMALLGPAPAASLGLATTVTDVLRRGRDNDFILADLAAWAAFPLLGGLMVRWSGVPEGEGINFGLLVFAVFAVTNLLNFALVVGPRRLRNRTSFVEAFRTMFIPVLPSATLAGALAVATALTYDAVGFAALTSLLIVLVLFQMLTGELLLSQRRAEELEERTEQLGALQVGVLATLIQTLALRDKMTARHSAAVARYTKSIAEEMGLDDDQQDLAHTAGLLHDVGKFIFPDSILFADRKLTDADWEIVKKHPAQGARLVRRVDGYGPVADIILAHHERIDGTGYPNNLSAEKIPLISRMISVADTFDVMTARDSYRRPVPRSEAIAELRRVSGAQLDGDVVEAFIRVLDRKQLSFQHSADADFESELGFRARVARFARQRAA